MCRTRTKLGITGELKGKSLDERAISSFIQSVSNKNILLFVVAIDLGHERIEDIEAHRDGQARLIAADAHRLNPRLKSEVELLADRLGQLPAQLYTQSTLLTVLCYDIIQGASLHYAQTDPEALAEVRWILDAKDVSATEYEQVWLHTVMPSLQSKSLESPFIQIREGDYSHFSRFENPDAPEPPEHLREHVRPGDDRFRSLDMNQVMSEVSFQDSAKSAGLQAVDVLAGAFRRACNDRLKRRGWRNIGRLMIRSVQSNRALQLLSLREEPDRTPRLPYAEVFREADRKALSFVRLDN